jgi:hypothetical protein
MRSLKARDEHWMQSLVQIIYFPEHPYAMAELFQALRRTPEGWTARPLIYYRQSCVDHARRIYTAYALYPGWNAHVDKNARLAVGYEQNWPDYAGLYTSIAVMSTIPAPTRIYRRLAIQWSYTTSNTRGKADMIDLLHQHAPELLDIFQAQTDGRLLDRLHEAEQRAIQPGQAL